MMNVALILAGGCGSRTGLPVPKQYIRVKERPLIAWCIERFERYPGVDRIQIVADEAWHGLVREYTGKKFMGFSRPGKTRQLSIVNGLADIWGCAGEEDAVIVHDAARPFITEELLESCLLKLGEYEGVMPVLPMKDTVYLCREGRVDGLLEREKVMAGQAPEVFMLGKYYRANLRLMPDRILGINGSSEPAVLAGMRLGCVPGDERNFKVTTRNDLERFYRIIGDEKE